jgi:hypothetical protein
MKADDTISAWSTNKPLAIVSAADTTFLRRRGYGCNPPSSTGWQFCLGPGLGFEVDIADTAGPSASLGMTNCGVVTFIRSRRTGWTEKK